MRMKRFWWLAIFLIAVMESCMPSSGESPRPVAFDILPNAAQWTLGDKVAYLFVTEKNWPGYYSTAPAGSDFGAYVYLVASLGMKPNPGYGVEFLELQQVNNEITVRLKLSEPEADRSYAQVIVYPIAVVRIRKAGLGRYDSFNVVFVDQNGKRMAVMKATI